MKTIYKLMELVYMAISNFPAIKMQNNMFRVQV